MCAEGERERWWWEGGVEGVLNRESLTSEGSAAGA